MSEWSLIVFTRTYYTDYRFLLIPEKFDIDQQNWARKHIASLISRSNNLPNKPRWAMFKNQNHLVFGGGFMMEDIIDNSMSPAITVDKANRPIRIFIGYVFQINKNTTLFDEISFYSENEFISSFKQLFINIYSDIIEHQRSLNSYEIKTLKTEPYKDNVPIRYSNKHILPSNENIKQKQFFAPSSDDHKLYLWKDNEDNRINIWKMACVTANLPPEKSFSLCFGFSSKTDILNTPFLNATADIKNEREILERNKNVENPASSPTEPPEFNLSNFISDNGIIPILLAILAMIIGFFILGADATFYQKILVVLPIVIIFSILGGFLNSIAKSAKPFSPQSIKEIFTKSNKQQK